MSARIGEVNAWLASQDASAFLVTAPVNVRYLSGFDSSSAALLVEGDCVRLFTDARYREAAHAVEGVEPVLLERNLLAELGRVLDTHTRGPVAFESTDLTVAAHARLAATSVELVAVSGVVERIRAAKEAHELEAIARAADVLSRAFERVPELGPQRRSERELAWLLERLMRDELGASAMSFPTIVAAGPNAAKPHHRPSERAIERDEVVLIDAGCVVDGYCSDCTRVFTTGSIPNAVRAAFDACRDIQAKAVASIRAGVEGNALDETHREALTEAGYSVDHSLGHGVGLEVHEEPRLARTSPGSLETGHVVTVEPGIYLPGLGGIRIEDMVVVTDEGGDVLTHATRDLVAL